MRNWPIRYKLLLLTVLPVVAVALAITVFWITMKLEDLTRALHERGRTLTEFIAPAAEYGVVSGNREHLAALTTGAREEPDLVRLVITDRDGLVLYHFDKRVSTDTDRTLTRWIATALSGDASLRFRRPIVLGTVEVAGERPEPVLGSRIVGDVTVTLSTWPTALRQAEWIIESILIAGSVLFLTILLTWWISRSLSAPLEQLAAIVTRFGRGILHERADTGVGGEIGVLEHGMNLMAERLESSHLRMEHEIRQATRGLLEQVHLIDGKNRELEQAWTLADEANRKKSLFLGNISHELRTPLNAIAGFIDLMEQDGRYGGDDARRLRILRDATSDLIELVNDLLDLTRIESGRIELRDEPFELAETLRNPIELLRNSHGTQGVDIVALVAADLPQRLRGDALRIKQVLFNLLSNAGKHSRNGAIVLDVQRQGDELRIAVEDDGDGIPASDLTRLFEPFVQLGEQPPRQSGTGLGLSITRSLVQLMGGRIEVDSQVGRGSCFTVYLPLNDGDDENSAAATTQPCVQDRPPAHVFADTERGRKHLFALARQVGLDVTVHADDAAYAQAMRGNERAVGLLHWWRPPARHATHVVAAVRDGRVRQIALLPVRGIDPTSQDMSCILHDVSALPDEVAASICGLFGVSDDDRTPAAPRTMPPPPRLCGLTFLVADDQEVNRMLLAEILRRNGARSVGAADGVEAVEAYRA
ncbi:MAG: ATP-binding protein, partial [Ectothiorhodospiraceae bacterium]|nr:ATP-binding protein [Ectothiorhodospiraceae bacterium]